MCANGKKLASAAQARQIEEGFHPLLVSNKPLSLSPNNPTVNTQITVMRAVSRILRKSTLNIIQVDQLLDPQAPGVEVRRSPVSSTALSRYIGRFYIRSHNHPHHSVAFLPEHQLWEGVISIFNLTPLCALVTGITFSPFNDILALSVGLDKKLVCDDTKTKKMIMSIQCENPLIAADIDIDGVSLSVGTSRGKVSIQSGYPVCPLSVIF